MGNHVNVTDAEGRKIGEMNLSIACFAVVNKIVEKYNGEYLPIFGDVNAALDRVYNKCEPHEEVQLLVFINDTTTFDGDDKERLDDAIRLWSIENDGPKKHLEFVRGLLDKHDSVTLKYSGVSTSAITVATAP